MSYIKSKTLQGLFLAVIRVILSRASACFGSWKFCFGNFTVTKPVYIEMASLALTLIIVNGMIVKSERLNPRAFGDT